MHNQYKFFRILIIALTISSVIPFLLYPAGIEYLHYDSALLLAPFLSYNNVFHDSHLLSVFLLLKITTHFSKKQLFNFKH